MALVVFIIIIFASPIGGIGHAAAMAAPVGPGTVLPYAEAFDKCADAPSGNAAEHFEPSTLEDGRIWTDKTVSADRAVIYDAAAKPAGSVEAAADEFLVTLSALSQSFSTDTIVEPSDTVFILDVSSSMYINKLSNGQSRVEAMVDALNEAIAALMGGNPHNRVAVVAFGGDSGKSRIVPILKLGRHAARDDKIFSMKSAAYIQVSSQIPDSALFDADNRSIRVFGGTPTQHGIYAGAKVLLDNPDTQYTYIDKGQPVSLTRKPNIVLFSDGGATLGWTDYKFQNPASSAADGNGFDCGDANNTDMGISILTVLTASYFKQQVQDHYYGSTAAGAAAVSDGAASAGTAAFYTVGLNVGGEGTEAVAILNPAEYAMLANRTFEKATYNMEAVLDDFTNLPAGSEIKFPALNKGSASARRSVSVYNGDGYIKSYDYANEYYPAENASELSAAFRAIVSKITSTGNYVTSVSGGSEFSGYLIFSDVLGEYMSFKGVRGMWYNNAKYDGHIFARSATQAGAAGAAYREKIIATLIEYGYFGPSPAAARANVISLLDSCIAAGKGGDGLYYAGDSDFSNKVKYYADYDRNWVSNFFDASGAAVLPPPPGARCVIEMYTMEGQVLNQASGEPAELTGISVHVITALVAGDFRCLYADGSAMPRRLEAGQQVVRWYIPAGLIPMRAVTPRYDGAGSSVAGVNIKEAPPVRLVYGVGLRGGLALGEMRPAYKAANGADGEDAYYFYANDHSDANIAMAFFQPGEENPCYYYTDSDAEDNGRVPLYILSGGSYIRAVSYSVGGTYYTMREYYDAKSPGVTKQEYTRVYESVTTISNKGGTGEPYILPGELKSASHEVWNKVAAGHVTDTRNYVIEKDNVTVGGRQVEVFRMGNNGRLKVPYTDVSVNKDWSMLSIGSPLLIEPEYVQLYQNGSPMGSPVLMTPTPSVFEDDYTWAELPIFELYPDAAKNVMFAEYTLKEGDMAGGAFAAYDFDTNPTPFAIYHRQPEWLFFSGKWQWEDGFIMNYEIQDTWWLTIEKIIEGDVPDGPGDGIDFVIFNDTTGTTVNTVEFRDLSGRSKRTIEISNDATAPESFTIREISNVGPGYAHSALSIYTDYTQYYEANVDAAGDDNYIYLEDVEPGRVFNVTFVNRYEDISLPSVTLTKAFPSGAPPEVRAELAFEIAGPGGYHEIVYFDDFDPFTGAYTLDGLAVGEYTITELYADAYGHSRALAVNGPPGGTLSGDTYTFTAQANAPKYNYEIEFVNTYAMHGALTIEKEITGLGPSEYPSDIVFHVSAGADAMGRNIYERYVEYAEMGAPAPTLGYRMDMVPPGSYTVSETGGIVSGFYLSSDPPGAQPDDPPTLTVAMAGPDRVAQFSNLYDRIPAEEMRASFTLVKVFEGLEAHEYPQDCEFTVTGVSDGGTAIYSATVNIRQFYDDQHGDKSYDFEWLPLGTYTIMERGGAVDGYALMVNHDAGYTLQLDYQYNPNYTDEVIFVNTYERDPASGPGTRVGDGAGGGDGGSGSFGIDPHGPPSGAGDGASGDSDGDGDDGPPAIFTGDHIWYIRGYEDNTLRPERHITRAEISMAFYRLLAPEMKDIGEPAAIFGDVPSGEWYGLAVDTLAHHGILSGYLDGSFRPDRPITRGELAAVVSRFEHLEESGENPYSDLGAEHWAYNYILSATAKGWFVGDASGRFRPDDEITRAEFVTVANRVLKRHILPADIPEGVHAFDDIDGSHWAWAAFVEAIYSHEYAYKEGGANEAWSRIIGDGLHEAYNR
ncbi:MAG: S-layer homology domain-containing protein [Oscillospiraceae bacterium]|nr:S-layer homology domain-containing protein [Oscillospiraceae bacterium]